MYGRNRFILFGVALSLIVPGLVAGCGTLASTSTPTFSGSTTSHSSVPSSRAASSSHHTTPPAPDSPTPPQAGVYSEMTIQVAQVAADGPHTINGRTLNAYTLSVSIHNPTSAMIPLALNDFSVEPWASQTYFYSHNDVLRDHSMTPSLFPVPIKSSNPSSVVRYIQPGSSVTGDITVMVPPSPRYQVIWGGSTKAAATFSVSS